MPAGPGAGGGRSNVVGASVRMALAAGAEELLGTDPDRVVATLQDWADAGLPLLPWLPGPLLDALAPLGIEVPLQPEGRRIARFLVGQPDTVDGVRDAVAAVREAAAAPVAKGETVTADEEVLWAAVADVALVLTEAYARLSPLVASGDRDAVDAAVQAALVQVDDAARSISDPAVQVAGSRPSRFTPPSALAARATIDLDAPWAPLPPPPPPSEPIVGTLVFVAACVAVALVILSGVVSGRWP